jgi:hypothetical protein
MNVTRDDEGNFVFPLHPNSLGASIVRHAEKHVYPDIAASALWLWDFPLVPARDCFRGCP